MTFMNEGGGVPRRVLALMLAEARKKAGMTQTQAAKRIAMSPSALGRMESGQISSKLVTIQALCRVYKVDDETAEAMEALALQSRAKGWWSDFGDTVPEWFEPYLSLEAYASRIRWYEAEVVPGLFQTPGYSRVLVENDPTISADEATQRVELQMSRQKLLADREPPLEVAAVLNEAILRRPVGNPTLMAEQFYRLVELSRRENVTIRVVPNEVGYHHGMFSGPFELLDFPPRRIGRDNAVQDLPTAYRDSAAGGTYWDRPDHVKLFSDTWDKLIEASWDEKRSQEFIATAAKEMT